MSIIIKPLIDHEKYMVNEHLVYKNRLRNWSCNEDLSDAELQAFKIYEKLIIKNKKIKKHLQAIYKN